MSSEYIEFKINKKIIMDASEKVVVGGLGIVMVLFIVLCIGYVNNFVKFVKLDFKAPYKAEVVRGVGVFTGLGGIIGLINVEDK